MLTTVLREIIDCKESGISNFPSLILDNNRTNGLQINARIEAINI
jgi:hypothetical protein